METNWGYVVENIGNRLVRKNIKGAYKETYVTMLVLEFQK